MKDMIYHQTLADIREKGQNYNYYYQIHKQEVKQALKRMINSKVVGTSNISIEV